ncbi:MAG TPA: agmatine deiminase family protein [Candidatus Sumerlaeota bacterium]|nr:agmatine deiminase family protein [Candidatus Sumerlaeota bacterium]
MPAEWEPHAATWLSWPKKLETWPGKFEPIPPIWARIARELAEGEDVRILVNDAQMEQRARKVLKEHKADASTVHFHHIPTNDVWTRDYGPIFVTNKDAKEKLVAIDWGYNSWGGKYPPYDDDDVVPHRIAEQFQLPVVDGGMILEGGSIDVNGAGLLLTSEQCLLNKNRNPHLTRQQIEQRIQDFLGVKKVLWLGDGIEGDDTDGHIDDITRFVGENTIVTVTEKDKSDSNHGVLQENLERLRDLRNLAGGKFEIIEMPMPDRVNYNDQPLPASYANFYIGNGAVLVPIYDSGKKDDTALGILRELFPGRRVVGIPSVDLVWGLGAFHCVTQQQPRI